MAGNPVVSGYLVKSPPLSSVDSSSYKKWHRRFFVLWASHRPGLASMLCYYDSENMEDELGQIELSIGCEEAKIVSSKKWDHVVSLSTPKRTYFFAADSGDAAQWWCDIINVVMARDHESIRSLEKIDDIPRGKPDVSSHKISKRKSSKTNELENEENRVPPGLTRRQMWRMCLPTFEKNEPRGKPKAVRPSSVEYASIEMMARHIRERKNLQEEEDGYESETAVEDYNYTYACIDISKTLALSDTLHGTNKKNNSDFESTRETRHDYESSTPSLEEEEDIDVIAACNDLLDDLEDAD
eukprot:m.172261 g.172261  ORF g.172261 m.172261 type:complete len:298 (-) comp15364_c1_seq7:1158-2051(-)